MGMLRLSAKTVGLSGTPSPLESEKTTILSLLESRRPSGVFHLSGLMAQGYSAEEVHQRLPFSSKARFIGLLMTGSLAMRWAEKPGGSLKVLASSAGVSGSEERTREVSCATRAAGRAVMRSKAVVRIRRGQERDARRCPVV